MINWFLKKWFSPHFVKLECGVCQAGCPQIIKVVDNKSFSFCARPKDKSFFYTEVGVLV